jgi:hypothetical protein
MEEGEIEVDSIEPIGFPDITGGVGLTIKKRIARESQTCGCLESQLSKLTNVRGRLLPDSQRKVTIKDG